MDNPPPEHPRASRKAELLEERLFNLRREAGFADDPAERAAIFFHLGSLYEHECGRPLDAMHCYQEATRAAPSFQPAWVAQMRLAERDLGTRDAYEVTTAMVESAHDPALVASSLVDLALRANDPMPLLRAAIDTSPEPTVAALLLEWLANAEGHTESLREALGAQARHASSSELRGAIWLDLALHELEQGDVDGALEALETASQSESAAWQARRLQRRIAKEHQRWDVWVRASTAMAERLEEASSTGESQDPLKMPVPPAERLPLAGLLWQDASERSELALGDRDLAGRYLEKALARTPDDVHARLRSLKLAEERSDLDVVAQARDWFRRTAPAHPAFVAHEIQSASSIEDDAASIETLRRIAAENPGSAYAQAALDVASIRAGAWSEVARPGRDREETPDETIRQLRMWRAALLDERQRTSGGISGLVDAAAVSPCWRAAILRDALGIALVAKDADSIESISDELLLSDLDAAERARVALSKYDVRRHARGDIDEGRRFLREALDREDADPWVPFVARVRGALDEDADLLARAHEALAELTEGTTRSGHLCAAARAHVQAGRWDEAERTIRLAMEAAPQDEHVVSLLDSVLRGADDPRRVVAAAEERALLDPTSALHELSLLSAGAHAERAGDLGAARRAYEAACRHAPDSTASALALADVGRRQSDAHAAGLAYGRLAESCSGEGVPQMFSLLQGDALSSAEHSARQAAAAYERALEHPSTALGGAVALLTLPSSFTNPERRAAAEETLGDTAGWVDASGPDFASAYGALRAALGRQEASAGEAWLQLAALAPTDGLRASALLQGSREVRIARGDQALDELFMLAVEAEPLADARPEAALALEEAWGPGDDPDVRVATLRRIRERGTETGRGAVEAACARASTEAGRGDEAVALLSRALEQRPDDLAVWEMLRTAGRCARQWPIVAQACERLAQFVEGELKADLLEEAGAVRLDYMEQHQQAEDLFRSALEADPSRDFAFRRLHDLLVEKEDAEALEALVASRLALRGTDDRPALLYERARLLRGFSDRPGALEVLDELFAARPDHAGALALAAEVHVSLAQWSDAVDCLRRLARLDIPEEQKRVAHLAAADFLETHLDAPDEALAELRAVECSGLADAATHAKIGILEEAAGRDEAAIGAHRLALGASPTHVPSIEALARLLQGDVLKDAVARFEKALWEEIRADSLDAFALEALRDAARWRGHEKRAVAVRAVEEALGLGAGATEPLAIRLDGASLNRLWDEGVSPPLREALRQAAPSLPKPRARGRQAEPGDPIYVAVASLCAEIDVDVGSILLCEGLSAPAARADEDGRIDFWIPAKSRDGLDALDRFSIGRLAWAAPHGAAWLVADSDLGAAGKIAALVRAARAEVESGEPVLPAAEVKLRRAARRRVHETLTGTRFGASDLVSFAQSLHRAADCAGLVVCRDFAAALRALLQGPATLSSLRVSPRAMDLTRFLIDAESPLWGSDA